MKIRLAYTYLALKNIAGISDETISRALGKLGTLDGVFDLNKTALMESGFNEKQASSIISRNLDRGFVEDEIRYARNNGINIITLEEGGYPAMLREIYAPPALLYFRGREEPLRMPSIGIVGSRKASRVSMNYTREIAADLAELGFNIVSGYALGVDINAHLGAVSAGFTTAVLGNGLRHVYPDSHIKYMDDILGSGCFLSEFPLEEPPIAKNFPIRNRIISGMCHGIVVVEASNKSGSLITARLANEQGREVFAVPAAPEFAHRATNELIKNGAKLVESYYDIVEEFSRLLPGGKFIDKRKAGAIVFDCPKRQNIFDNLGQGPLSRDELCINTGLSVEDMMVLLAEMELEGYIVNDLDGKYRVNGGIGG